MIMQMCRERRSNSTTVWPLKHRTQAKVVTGRQMAHIPTGNV